jgi:hypothetical protein
MRGRQTKNPRSDVVVCAGRNWGERAPGIPWRRLLPVASGVHLPLSAGEPLPDPGASSATVQPRATPSVVAAADPEPFYDLLIRDQNIIETQYNAKF